MFSSLISLGKIGCTCAWCCWCGDGWCREGLAWRFKRPITMKTLFFIWRRGRVLSLWWARRRRRNVFGLRRDHSTSWYLGDPELHFRYHVSEDLELVDQDVLDVGCFWFLYSFDAARAAWPDRLAFENDWVCSLANLRLKGEPFLDVEKLWVDDHSFLEETRVLGGFGCLLAVGSAFGLLASH